MTHQTVSLGKYRKLFLTTLSSEVLLSSHFFGKAQKTVQDGFQVPSDLDKGHI